MVSMLSMAWIISARVSLLCALKVNWALMLGVLIIVRPVKSEYRSSSSSRVALLSLS